MDFSWVTTLQFGTKYCRIAFQPRSDFVNNPSTVMEWTFSGTIKQSDRFPSSLLLNKLGNVCEFGYQALDMANTEAGEMLIENLGESLYTSEEFDQRTLVKDSRGNTHKALNVLAMFIKAVFDYSNRKISDLSGNSVIASDVKWVITVPSVRADKAVPFFRSGCEKVGISNKMDTMVTYPDSALTYCLYVHHLRHDGNNLQLSKFREGERVLLLGFEEELDSFNVYEKADGKRFKQVIHYLSGSSSKVAIMQSFDELFGDLIGTWIWKTAKQIDETLWLNITEKIEKLLELSELGSKITFSSMFTLVKEICLEHTNMTLQQIIESSQYASKVKCFPDKLRIDKSLIIPLFEKTIQKVIHNIKYVLSRSDDKPVETMIMIGNKSGLFYEAIHTAFPQKQICVPDGAVHAALKGATLYGHEAIIVSTIFCGAQVMVSS